MFASIVAGAKFGLGHEPLRTLLLLSVMLGGSFSVMQISMPRVVEEVYGREAGGGGRDRARGVRHRHTALFCSMCG